MGNLLDIVIVNWNSGAQLKACTASLTTARQGVSSLQRVVVVDNASSDGSADGDCYSCSLPVTVIHNTVNRGFAAACNQGAEGSLADFLLFLNPDSTIRADSLATAIEFMERPESSGVGACGAQLLDERGQVTRSCSRFPRARHFYTHMLGVDYLFPRWFESNFMSDWDHSESRLVDVATGAFLLVRRGIFERLGGFDERFFLYLEDVDFQYSLDKAGWQSYYLATAQAYHKGGGCSEQIKAKRLYYSVSSRILYSYKHFGWVAATGILLGTLLVEPFSRMVLAFAHKSLGELQETMCAYLMLWRSLPSLLKRHRRAVKHNEPSPQPVQSQAD